MIPLLKRQAFVSTAHGSAMAEAFNPDEVEKFLPAIAAAGRAALGSAKVAGKAAASKVGGAAKVAGSKAAEIGSEVASKVGDVAERAKDATKTTEGMMTDKQKTLSQAASQAKQQMHDSQMQNMQQRRDQEQRAIETARSAASTGSQIGKAEDFEIDYDTPSHLSSGDILSPDTMCQMCKQNPAQYKAGYSSRGRPNTPIEYNLCEACFDSFGTGGAMSTYSRFIRGSPMNIAWQLLKAQQTMLKSNEYMEEAFDLGYPLIDHNDLHDKQRAIVDLIANKDGARKESYWNDPASGEYETDAYNGLFRQDTHQHYPDEAFEQYHRYLQHYFDAAEQTAALPRQKQMEIMDAGHPEHPNRIAMARMAKEFPEWDVENPHRAFDERYYPSEEERRPQRGRAARMASGGFLRSEVLVKERQSPEAMRHKREYDAAYNKRPDQVKYREELNRERRRRGIMGSHDHMDVSHTQGGKLTLEPEHSNRARHFRDKGTLRVVKSVKDDVEILRNLMQGPMDEQDKKIATAMVGMLEERHADEEEESELVQPMFGGAHLFA